MQSIELLAHEFGRVASMGLAGALAAAGALNAAIAESPAPAPRSIAAPVPAVQTLDAHQTHVTFTHPVKGFEINSQYGYRRLPGEPKARLHAGIDIAAPSGVPVHASAAGVVIEAGRSPTYGNYVEVDHGEGVSTFYAHLTRAASGVREGVRLDEGDTLGFVGSTGRSTGPHLHFEVRQGERKFDPMKVLGRTFASIQDLPFVRASASEKPPYTILRGRVRQG